MPFLVTPPLPNLTVEIAFDSGFATPEGDRTWTDISDYVEGASSVDITYGRADELSTPDPNTCSLTLDNRDGRFTPAKSSSPYFPNVKKGKPLRVTVTYAGVDYIRFTGYVNEWPLVWPDSTSAAATVSISASSRRARLGQTAPLTSAIRAAYLATSPYAYWPMDENLITTGGRNVFRDITNSVIASKATQSIGGFYDDVNRAPRFNDGTTPAPTDEAPLLVFPSNTDAGLIGTFDSYVGAGSAISVPPAGDMTVEVAAAFVADSTNLALGTIFDVRGSDGVFQAFIGNDGPDFGDVGSTYTVVNPDTGATLDTGTSAGFPHPYNTDTFRAVNDGEIHHIAITLTSSTTLKLYVDGALESTLTAANPFTRTFTSISFGPDRLRVKMWLGHAAVHKRALSAAEILAHAQAATAATETPSERIVRVAGRVGVPAAEVDAAGTTASVGAQAEAGRSASEVIDELSASIGGIVYDTREGHLALQSRGYRYNRAADFTLSALLQEIGGDLTPVMDDRYLVNTVEFSRSGTDGVPATITDDDSIDSYGVYKQTFTIVSSSDIEVEAAAQNLLTLYADPIPRYKQVTVDVVNLDSPQRALVLDADIGSRFAAIDLPTQAPAVSDSMFLEGYTESITSASHTLTMNTTPGDVYQNVFVWDDATRGVWDTNDVWAY